MTWTIVFLVLAVLSAGFGFGPFATSDMGRWLATIFAGIGLGAFLLRSDPNE